MRKLIILALVPALAFGGQLDTPMPSRERGSALTTALAAAPPGGVIELEEGTYTGPFFVTSKTNLTIRPKPGARVVLTLRDPRFATTNALWVPLAAGVYTTPEFVGSSIYRLDGRRVPLAKDREQFDQISAMGVSIAFREAAGSLIYLEGDDPRAGLWISKTDQAVIACDRSPGLKLEGLDIRFGGAVGINAVACADLVVEGNWIYGGRDGVRLKNGDSPRARLRGNWVGNHIDRRWWWRDMKGNVPFEGSGITAPGENVRIEENTIVGWFNGIGTAALAGQSTVDPIIRANLIEDILDDAIEMDGITVRGEVFDNTLVDVFVGFSFAPRLVRTPGEVTRVHHNVVYATRTVFFDRNLGPCSEEFVGAGCGYPSGTKFNGAPGRDLLFDHNRIHAYRYAVRGAPSGGPAPINVKWIANHLSSIWAPLVRETGLAQDGNEFQQNVYHLEHPAPNMFQLWAGTRSFATLDQARASAEGVASGWERQPVDGVQLIEVEVTP